MCFTGQKSSRVTSAAYGISDVIAARLEDTTRARSLRNTVPGLEAAIQARHPVKPDLLLCALECNKNVAIMIDKPVKGKLLRTDGQSAEVCRCG